MSELEIRQISSGEAKKADLIMKTAFGTFIGLKEPERFAGDSSYVRSRWSIDKNRVFGAFLEGELIGSNVATLWGTFGFFGPLSIHPDYWGRGFAGELMEPVMDLLTATHVKACGLFTFPDSLKHISMYEKFGFYSSYLTIVLAKSLSNKIIDKRDQSLKKPPRTVQEDTLTDCRVVSESIFPGLNLREELLGAAREGQGSVLVTETRNSFALCHSGKGSEAGSKTSYLKFAAVRANQSDAKTEFQLLLDLCEAEAISRGSTTLVAGVNAGRRDAYRVLREKGYKPITTGISMVKPGGHPFSSPKLFIIDDWR